MTNVPKLSILSSMGRWLYGLLAAATFAAGCASAAPPTSVSQQNTGSGSDGGADLGGVVVGMCTDGGSCSTGNPGDCAMGHAVCSGDVQSCVPDVTTQRCYTGPAATLGKGICKAGMQTCIGALGSCDGQVLPLPLENCFNDLDDDCDGVVNNGCPDHLTTGTPRALTAHGNAAGGTAFSLRCPANAYLTKIVVYAEKVNTDGYDAGVDIVCATPTLVRGTSSYTVMPTAATANPATNHGGNIDTTLNGPFDCGTASFSPGFYVQGLADAGGIDSFGMSCGVGSLTLDNRNQLSISITKSGSLGYYGYNFGTAFEDDCMAGEVLVGIDGRMGNWDDEAHGVCAPLQVVYK